jgi:hypothetical protein
MKIRIIRSTDQMENAMEIHTLHDFFSHTKGIIYILIIAILIGMTAFWKFLTGGDED